MIPQRLKRLGPYRVQIAAGVVAVLTLLGLVTAQAEGLIGATPSADASPAPTPSASAEGTGAGGASLPGGGGGAKNIVQVINKTDNQLTTRGRVQLDPIPGPNVQPVNAALALGMCSQCDTFAVALQINLVGPNPSIYVPQNVASATNAGCDGCITVAVAYQYNIQSSDPTAMMPRLHQLVAAMNRELVTLSTQPGLSVTDAEAQIDAVIGQFQDLAQWLIVQRQESTAQTDLGATPTPSLGGTSPAPVASPSTEPSPSPTESPSPTPAASASP